MAAAPNAAANQENQAPWWHKIGQMMMMYYVFNMIRGAIMPSAPVNAVNHAVSNATVPAQFSEVVNRPPVPDFRIGNIWRNNQPFNVNVFVSRNETADIDVLLRKEDPFSSHIWSKEFTYDWENQLPDMFGDTLPPNAETVILEQSNPAFLPLLQANATLYAHAYFSTKGFPLSPSTPGYLRTQVIHTSAPMIAYRPRPKKQKKNLLDAGAAEQPIVDDGTYEAFLLPDLSLRLLHDFTVFNPGEMPPDLLPHYKIDKLARGYTPVAYIDRFWSLKEKWVPVNATLATANVTVSYTPTSMVRWRLQAAMEDSWRNQESMGLNAGENDTQELKRMIMETQPWLLLLTMTVSMLHMVFDMLAFKNDIAFWKDNKSNEGLSIRSLFFSAASQLVIFLYLLENETSWMVLMSNGVSVIIDCWKITKATDVVIDAKFPFVHIEDKADHKDTETAKYDKEASRYLSWALVPLVLGYSVYALMTQQFTSYYQWILSTLVGTVYTFGFIQMFPQLYLNYKLKSVAHLPWRMLTYKALNTVIDDLFAFIIKMPTLHRLACFRDDIVFGIFLYQRWIYRVDYTRANEFGVSFLPNEDAAVEDKTENKTEDKTDDKGDVPAVGVTAEKSGKNEKKVKVAKETNAAPVEVVKKDTSDDAEDEKDEKADKSGELRRRTVNTADEVD